MIRTRRIAFAATLALGGLAVGAGATRAQDLVRSVIVNVDTAGRILPQKPGGPTLGSAKRYWADLATNSIRRSNLDGSAVEEIATGLHVPYGLSYDAANGNLLWTSSDEEVVQAIPAGGGTPIPLQSEFEEPYAIVIALDTQQVAYLVDGNEVVKVTQLPESDVEQREVLLTFDATTQPVHGLALDEKAGVLYIGDGNGQMTRKIRLADRWVESLTYVDETFPIEPFPSKRGAR